MYFFDCSNTFKIFKNFFFWVQFCISLIPLLDKESIHGFIQWTLYEWLHLSIKSGWCKCRWTCVWPFTPVDIVVCQWSNPVHLFQNESLLTPMSLCCQSFNEETLLIDLKSLFRPHVPKTDHAHVQNLPQNPLENSK